MALTAGLYPLQAVLGAVKAHVVVGMFTGADGSISGSVGHGWVAARTGEGVYTVTLNEKIKRCVGLRVSVGGTGSKAVTISETTAGQVYTIRTFISNTAAADDVVGQISFEIWSDESSAPVR